MGVLRVDPAKGLRGEIRVPADKSLTHRAILLAAVSDRAVRVGRTLESADTAATLGAVEACGVTVAGELGGELRIDGVGLRGLRPAPAVDCVNAGTLMRLLTGLLVGQEGDRIVLDGDESLRRRPMGRIATPLRAMGASIWTAPGGTPPIVVSGGAPLRGIVHDLPVASAQVKSCLLLAGLFAHGVTTVREPGASRDHTERLLRASGVDLIAADGAVGVPGPVEGLALPDVEVPGDPSSAAPLAVAAALRADPEVRLLGVNLNPGRIGLFHVMERMGVPIRIEPAADVAGEPCGDVVVGRADRLECTDVAAHEVPSMIDELPLVGLLAAFATGTTRVRGAAELRVKETDRIAAVVDSLRRLGVHAVEREDGFEVTGAPRVAGGDVASCGDHRMAMLGAVAGLASSDGVRIDGFEAVEVSYPGFARDLGALGAVGR